MPTRLTDSITRALRDQKLSNREMETLVREARKQPLTVEVKAELSELLATHGDKFSLGGKRELERYLGTTTVPPPPAPPPAPRTVDDPTVLTKHATDTTWKPVDGGQLYVDGISYDDVVQGSIANCYLVGALSAVAHANPDTIKNAITSNADGTYTVRFFEKSSYSGLPREVKITVDGDLPQSSFGSARYAKSRDGKELWVGLVEKAYAQWKGGYEAIGNGGYASDMVTALTGKTNTYSASSWTDADVIYENIQRGARANKPMTAPTHGKDSGVDYSGTGVYAWHVYTVLGASEEAGTKYVELRNPWGNSEHGSDGKNDGIFKMKLEDFTKLYQGVEIGN